MTARTLMIATAALAASAAATVPASADPAPRHAAGLMGPAVMFNLIDRNGDGIIDKDEAGVVTAAIFAALDTNSDGKLTKDELGNALRRMHMRGGPGFRDGSRDDGSRWHMGRDGWGRWGHGPGRGMMAEPGEREDTARGGPGPMMGQGTGEVGPRGLPTRDFATFDTNGDGVISREEFEAAPPLFRGMGPPR
jgi:hypothetical protein